VRDEAEVDLPEVSQNDRLFLMAQLVYAIAWLHNQGWVYGDLSYKNVVFALGDAPRIMLLDCDGAAPLGDLARKQAHSLFWKPPESESQQDKMTDVYKLGLAIVRYLKPAGKRAKASQAYEAQRIADILDGDGVSLLEMVLRSDPAKRPTAKELYMYLRQFTEPRMTPPRVVRAELAMPLVMRDSDAKIFWEIENAETVLIRIGENHQVGIKWADNRDSCVFRAVYSGPVSVVASNPYGEFTHHVGDLMLYELPSFSVTIGNLPRPTVPPVEAFSLEPLGISQIHFPISHDNLLDLTARGPLTPPWPRIDDALLTTSKAVVDLIADETTRYLTNLRGRDSESGHE
jgi:serine/threonine protein kinase